MGRAGSSSNGRDCKPLHGTCKLAPRREPKGSTCILSKPCPDCAEWRCRAHCLCGRGGKIGDGSKMPRSARPTAPSSDVAVAAPQPVLPIVKPAGRQSLPNPQKLGNKEWWGEVVAAVQDASEVELSSYMYDHPQLHKTLALRMKMKDQSPIRVRMCLDREAFHSGTPYHQLSRVNALRKLGAEVFLCRGECARGVHHKKAVVVDRRTAYTGGANLTQKSLDNGEFNFKMRGPIVNDILEDLASVRSRSAKYEP